MVLEWNDPRLRWKAETGIPGWKFPETIYYPSKHVWVPRFRLANSESDNSYILASPDYTLELNNTGQILYEVEKVLRASCELNLDSVLNSIQILVILVFKVKFN